MVVRAQASLGYSDARAMEHLGGANYRGIDALRGPSIATAVAAIADADKKGRGGTVGKATRQGTKRSFAEATAYAFDLDGIQKTSLRCSMALYMHSPSRATVCASGGTHSCGLILCRPPRPSCSASSCACDADTTGMAEKIGKWKGSAAAMEAEAAGSSSARSAGKAKPPSRESAVEDAAAAKYLDLAAAKYLDLVRQVRS